MESVKKSHEIGITIGLYKRWRVATGIVVVFFLVSLSGLLYPPLENWSSKFANRDYNGEGLIEILEAICWLSASIVYLVLLFKEVKINRWNLTAFWFLFFSIFCFTAFGEEISWGQHLFKFEPTESVIAYNKQKEYNIHNLNISEIFHLDKDNPARPFLLNFNMILNPLFYALCGVFWFIIPLLKKTGRLTRNRLLSSLPAPALATVIFLGVNMGGYLVIDKLIFDVGEIFELALALAGIMVSLDILFKESIRPELPAGIFAKTK